MKRKHKLAIGLLAVLCCVVLACVFFWARMALSGPEESLPAEGTFSAQPSDQGQGQVDKTPEAAETEEKPEESGAPSSHLESAAPSPSTSGNLDGEQAGEPSSQPSAVTGVSETASPAPSSIPSATKPPSPSGGAAEPTEAVTAPNSQAPQQQAPVATYTLSVRCDTLSAKRESLDPGIAALVPENGVVLQEVSVEAKEGETAFSLLQRVLREKKIHLEFQTTPGIGSVYVEGIANLYEMDGGPLSGWLYQVNGVFHSASASDYVLSPGDRVVWLYTCDLGRDVGAPSVAQ